MERRTLGDGMVLAGLLVTTLVGWAQETPTRTGKNTFSFGVTWTEGNSKTVQGKAALVSTGERERLGSYRAALEGAYGESRMGEGGTTRTLERASASLNVKKTITPRSFGYLDTSVLYDGVADIDYRVTVSPGLGGYLVKKDRTSLSSEIGPGWIFERAGSKRDDYPVFRAAERFEQKLSETAVFWQNVEYLPEASAFGHYLLSGEAGIEAAINTRFNLRLAVQDRYDSRPSEGRKKNDLILTAGLSVNL